MMKIATIYTLYGRRAGAELCFEKTIEAVYQYNKQTKWTVFCNKQAEDVLKKNHPYVLAIYIPFLDNQYKKAFWLEFLSQKFVKPNLFDCFWIPSGCNHFPGHWKVPVLTTFHDLGEYHIKNKYSFARTVFRKQICIPRAVKRSKGFTAVSQFTANDLEKFLKLPTEQTQVVYNGNSPHNRPNFREKSDDILKLNGLEKGSYLFTPGRTDYIGKGLDILIQSFREIRKDYPKMKLVLVGPKGEAHESLMKEIENEKNIYYLGRVSNANLNTLYENCKATVIASRFEGFGFPVLEAMQYHVPIICSNAGSLPEIAHNAAIIFESGVSHECTKAIRKVIETPTKQLQLLIEEGQKRLTHFSWTKCGKEMHQALESICKK